MGLLTFSINVTLDGCIDHREGIADDETHAFFTRLMDESGAMLWGRVTYEMMESYWPAVARGDTDAPAAMREWAVKLDTKPKYVVSSTRKNFPWNNSHHIAGDLRMGVQKLKAATPDGVLLGSGKLATELDRLDLIDEYRLLVHPRIAGHGPTLYESGLPGTRRLELISAKPLRSGAVAMHYRRAGLAAHPSGGTKAPLMQPYDLAIPTLPCRSVSATVAFYKRLGFDGGAHEFSGEYAILRRGAIELHFFTHKELVPGDSSAGCYIRVLDVEEIFRSFSSSQLPRTGIPRMDALENKPWGLREFAIVDPDGNLLRIGQVIAR